MVDVGRLGRIERHARLDAERFRRRRLAGADVFQADVGRDVHLHAHVPYRAGIQEELLEGAVQAVVHRPDAEAVGDDLRTDAAAAVVDHEGVAARLQYVAEHRIGPPGRERLGHDAFILEQRGEIAERFQPVGQCRVALALALERIGGWREAAVVFRPHDDGVAVAVDDLVAVDHGEDRFAGLAFGDPWFAVRVTRLVVDHRLAGRSTPDRGQAHLFLGHGIAVGTAVFWLHHHLTEQAIAGIPGAALAAEGGALAANGECPFALGVQRVATARAGFDQIVAVAADVGGDIADGADRLHAIDQEADVAVGYLVVGLQFQRLVLLLAVRFPGSVPRPPITVRVGLIGQQVLQVHRQAVAGGHPQHDRTRTLVRAQADLAGLRHAAAAEQHAVVVHHIAAQGVDHAVDVLRAEAVEHQRLVDGHHVGHQVALAAHRRLRPAAGQVQRQGQQPRTTPGEKSFLPTTLLDHGDLPGRMARQKRLGNRHAMSWSPSFLQYFETFQNGRGKFPSEIPRKRGRFTISWGGC
ncbi:hypothetical protein D3C78_939340 [compost metagenome]